MFCIYDIKNNTAIIFIYRESTANKGPDEVCSMLNDFLKDVTPSYTVTIFHSKINPLDTTVFWIKSVKQNTLTRHYVSNVLNSLFDNVLWCFPRLMSSRKRNVCPNKSRTGRRFRAKSKVQMNCSCTLNGWILGLPFRNSVSLQYSEIAVYGF